MPYNLGQMCSSTKTVCYKRVLLTEKIKPQSSQKLRTSQFGSKLKKKKKVHTVKAFLRQNSVFRFKLSKIKFFYGFLNKILRIKKSAFLFTLKVGQARDLVT